MCLLLWVNFVSTKKIGEDSGEKTDNSKPVLHTVLTNQRKQARISRRFIDFKIEPKRQLDDFWKFVHGLEFAHFISQLQKKKWTKFYILDATLFPLSAVGTA